MAARQPRPPDLTTTTSSTAIVVNLLVDVLALGRRLELTPELRDEANAAFAIATGLRGVLRHEAIR